MNLYALFLSFLAGLTTVLGGFLLLVSKKEEVLLPKCASFSSGVMITVSFLELLKEAYWLFHSIIPVFLFFFFGFFLSFAVESIGKGKGRLYQIGLATFCAIILHNIPEGIISYMTTVSNWKVGFSLVFAIALHNIPEGSSISIPIFHATKSYKKAFFYVWVAATSEPLGALLSAFFFPSVSLSFLAFLYSLTAGLMTFISIFELLPLSFSYRQKESTYCFFFFGVFIMLFTHFFL